ADPFELSLASTFPRFLALEREHGSVIRGLKARSAAPASGPRYGLFATLRSGLGTWVEALASRIGEARTDTRVVGLDPDGTVRTAKSAERFDAVILAVPAHAAAPLVRAFDPALGRDLDAIHYGSSVTVAMGFRESAIGRELQGAGFVVPAIEEMDVVGGTFAHLKFEDRAPAGHALLRAFFSDRALGWDDAECVRRALAAL